MPNMRLARSANESGIFRNDNFWDTFNFSLDVLHGNSREDVRRAYGAHRMGCTCIEVCGQVQNAYSEYRGTRCTSGIADDVVRVDPANPNPNWSTLGLGLQDYQQEAYRPALRPLEVNIDVLAQNFITQSEQAEVQPMPEETLVAAETAKEDDPIVVKRASEVNPVNPESILLSAKLSRGAKGLTLYLKSPILESFFRLLAEDRTITVSSPGDRQRIERWKIGHVIQYLNEGRNTNTNKACFPIGGNYYQFVVEGTMNLQLLTTKGLGEGIVLHCDIPMSKHAMSEMLDTLKLAAKDIYLSFCVPVEGSVELSVRERLSATGGSVVE